MNKKPQYITAEEAVALVKSGDQIVTGLGAAEAGSFLGQLHTVLPPLEDVTLTNCLPVYPSQIYDKTYANHLQIEGWFYGGAMRKAHGNGNVAFIPNHLHLAGSKRLDYVKPNIFVGTATLPDKHGYVSLSLSNTYEKKMIEAADLVIIEVNPNFPYTFGDVQLHISEIDYLVSVDYQPALMPDAPFSEKDAQIGQIIADMVPDGSCIQLGIGGIPNAVAEYLKEKNDLGVHTEMMTTGMMHLAKLGVINGKKKQAEKGKIVATFAMGTAELYEYMDYNPSIAMMDGAWTNDPYIIARNDNQVSINTTLEVDLTGQCASESLGSKQFSGTGGQADTAIGAQMSKNGKSIIALYSTAMVRGTDGEKHEVSKIAPQLMTGAAVSLSRNDVDIVVTEYGAAHLRGTSLRQRVERLIEIAHPKFREELWEQALAFGIITRR